MLRLLFLAIVFYLIYQVLRLVLASTQRPRPSVRGRRKNPPLDLSGQDVEDAKFEEIKKK